MPTDDRPTPATTEQRAAEEPHGPAPTADPRPAERQAQRSLDEDEVPPDVQYGEDPGVV